MKFWPWQQASHFPQSHDQQLPLRGGTCIWEPFPLGAVTPGPWRLGSKWLHMLLGSSSSRTFPSMMLSTRAFRSGHQSSDMPQRCWSCHRSKGECFLPAEFAAALWLMGCWALFYGRVSPTEGHTPSSQDLNCSACSSRFHWHSRCAIISMWCNCVLAIINVELKEKGAISKEQMHQNHKVPLTQMRLWGKILMSLIYSFSKLGLTFFRI